MVDKLFKGVSVPKLIWAISLSLLMYIPIFLSGTVVPQQFSFWLFTDFFAALQNLSPYLLPALISVIIFLHSLLIVFIGQKFLLIEHRTYLPMFQFLGVSLFYTASPVILGVLISATFILLAINLIFQNVGYKVSLRQMFNFGMLMMIAALFFWPVIFVIPILWVMTFFVNSFNIRSFSAMILGFLTLSLVMLYGLIALGKLDLFWDSLKSSFVDYPNIMEYPRLFQISVLIVGFTLAIGFLREFFALERKKIIVRKYFHALNFLFFTTFLVAFFVPFVPLTFSYFGILSLILGSSNLLLSMRMRRLKNFLFTLFTAGIVLFWIGCFNLL